MVKVYFETKVTPLKRYAELVAVFDCEETYMLCLPALEQEAEKRGMFVTESIEDLKTTFSGFVKESLNHQEKGGESC